MFSIQSSVYSAITVAKICQSPPGYGLLQYVSVEIDTFRCEQMSNPSSQFLKKILVPVPFCPYIPEYQVLLHISIHKFIPIEAGS